MLIGFMFNILLYGMLLAQTYMYYTSYKRDKWSLKLFVFLIIVADTANTIFDFIYLYRALILHFDDPDALATADFFFATDPAITGIIAVLVQFFFAWRLGALTKSWALVAVVCLGSLLGGVSAIATSFEVGRTPWFVNFRNFKSVVIVWLASSALTDLIITTFLVSFLQTHKSGFKNSDLIIDRIIRLTIQTGLVTAVVATFDLVLFLASPTGLHLIFNFPLCKLYSNSLISSLNARQGWRFGSAYGGSSNLPSFGVVNISLASAAPTSPTLLNNPTPVLGNPVGSYDNDNFNDDGGTFTLHGQKVHFNTSGMAIPLGVMHLEKDGPLDTVDLHEMQDVIGSGGQELPHLTKEELKKSVLFTDTEMTKRTSRTQDKETEEVYEIV